MATDFQVSSSQQGREFESAVATALKVAGWLIDETNVRFDGIEIDIAAISPEGERCWIECKGSWLSSSGRNGGLRHDTVRKALFTGYHLLHSPVPTPPYMIIASHLPDEDTTIGQWITRAKQAGAVRDVILMSNIGALT